MDAIGAIHIAFGIARCDLPAWERWLQEQGISIELRKTWKYGGEALYFRDPDGHLLEVVTPGVWNIYGPRVTTWHNSYSTNREANSPMSPKTSSPMIATLLILGGTVFGVLGALHTVYTLLDLHNPRRLVPVDLSVADAMAKSALRLSGGRTDMWRAWIGFNFSHSLGVLLVAALALWAGFRIKTLPVGIILPALTLIGCVYEVLALLYWFRIPAIGVAVGTGCFATAWVLSLR